MMKASKIAVVAMSLGITLVSLSGCGNQDQIYTDATHVLKIIQHDIENDKPFSYNDFQQIDQFLSKYKNVKMGTEDMKVYLDTIDQVEKYADETYKGIK